MGLCCAFRTSALRSVGGFDVRFRRAGEDIDVCLRLRAAGGRLVYRPDLWVAHRRQDTVGSLARMVARHSYGQVRAVKVNGGAARGFHLQAARWLAVSTVSSLRRHRSPALAMLGVPLCCLSLASQLAARVDGARRDS